MRKYRIALNRVINSCFDFFVIKLVKDSNLSCLVSEPFYTVVLNVDLKIYEKLFRSSENLDSLDFTFEASKKSAQRFNELFDGERENV